MDGNPLGYSNYIIGHQYNKDGKLLKDYLQELLDSPEEDHLIVNYDMFSYSSNVHYTNGTLLGIIPEEKDAVEKLIDKVKIWFQSL